MIQWDFESPLYIDETISTLSKKLIDKDFVGVPRRKWENIAKLWMNNNPEITDVNKVIYYHKQAAINLINEYKITWVKTYKF